MSLFASVGRERPAARTSSSSHLRFLAWAAPSTASRSAAPSFFSPFRVACRRAASCARSLKSAASGRCVSSHASRSASSVAKATARVVSSADADAANATPARPHRAASRASRLPRRNPASAKGSTQAGSYAYAGAPPQSAPRSSARPCLRSSSSGSAEASAPRDAHGAGAGETRACGNRVAVAAHRRASGRARARRRGDSRGGEVAAREREGTDTDAGVPVPVITCRLPECDVGAHQVRRGVAPEVPHGASAPPPAAASIWTSIAPNRRSHAERVAPFAAASKGMSADCSARHTAWCAGGSSSGSSASY